MMLYSQHIFVLVSYVSSLHCFLLLFLYTNMVIITVIDECKHLHFTCVTSVIVMMWTCRQCIGGED